MPASILVSQLGVYVAADRIRILAPFITPSVGLNLVMGGYHLMVGLLLGVVKYYQVHNSPSFTAHPYISVGHRASLLYGFASFQLAGMALISSWSESTNTLATIATQFFFANAVLSYAVHGFLRDTTNQFKRPHKLGEKWTIPPVLVQAAMFALILAEVGGCGVLVAGSVKTIFDIFSVA
ncbi:hypothetical protein B0O80DRAFT_497924 [Mortierella sp. GBAus27b]|nr:hypothetical protein BGX31_006775 [Mortierella sp. GBA43]KAI8354706.1 hypothetical protein B0O80DRAFT_497924 [Mortierella sp. GBAus27b]